MRLKARGWLTLAIMLELTVGLATADQMGQDFPHNTVNGIGCANCHYLTSDTPPSWVTQIPENADDTEYNNLCWGCHNNAIAPYMNTHSSLATSDKYGSWTVECRTCHGPHHQLQARTWGAPGYLATGASTGLAGRTLTAANANWTVNAFVGNVLIPNTAKISYQYPIISNTNDTITLSVDINAGIAAVGNTFAVIYGQLINTPMATPNSSNRTVKFFRQTGANSFADGDATYDGICEVCHTQTNHYRNDGTAPDQSHANLGGKDGTDCISCHRHENGFSHASGSGSGCGTADTCHGVLQSHATHLKNSAMVSATCASCHLTNSFPLFADGQGLATTTACNGCHGAGTAKAKQYWAHPGSEALTAGSWLVAEGNASYCGSCHGASIETDHNNFGPATSCIDCHSPLSTHTQIVNRHFNAACTTCHVSADIAVNNTITKGKSSGANMQVVCIDCHTGPGVNAMHGLTDNTVYDVHDQLAASNQVGQQNCGNCHLQDTAAQRLNLHANLSRGISNCNRCHASADLDVKNAIASGISGTVIYCETCHNAKGKNLLHGLTTATVADVHDKFSASNAGVSEGNCANCHVTDAVNNRIDLHTACTTCHATHATEISVRSKVINDGRASNHAVPGGNAIIQYCESCHPAKNQYRMHGLAMADAADAHTNFTSSHKAEKACYNCHVMTTANNSLDLHPLCSTCHARHAIDVSARTVAINDGRESGHLVGGGNGMPKSCESCHAAKGVYKLHGLTDDNGVDGVADVHDKLTGSTGMAVTFTNAKIILKDTRYNCANCHSINQGIENAAAWASRIRLHTAPQDTGSGNCLTCHTHAGSTDEITLGRQAGHHLGGGGNTAVDCENCHDSGSGPSGKAMYQYDGTRHHLTTHAQKGDCTYCHADPRPASVNLQHAWAATADIDGAGVDTQTDGWVADIGAATVRNQLACRECHTNRANQYQNPGYAVPPTVNTGGNDLIVYKNTYTPANLTSAPGTIALDVTDNGVAKTVQVEKHRIVSTGTAITPYNFGACLSCHTVQTFHARPSWSHVDTNPVEDEPYDVLRFSPGRGKFNLFERCTTSNYPGTNLPGWQHGQKCSAGKPHNNSDPTKSRGKNIYNNVEGGGGNNSHETVAPGLNAASNLFQQLNPAGTAWINTGAAPYIFGQMQSIPRSNLVNNAENLLTANANIPYFTDITAPVVDDITITKADWNGTVVTVWATNALGSGQAIVFSYSDNAVCNNTAMAWDGSKFVGVCNTTSYTSPVATVTVTNTSTAGGSRKASVVNNS